MSAREASVFRNGVWGLCGSFTICCRNLRRPENVAMPLLAGGVSRKAAMERARLWLSGWGWDDREDTGQGS